MDWRTDLGPIGSRPFFVADLVDVPLKADLLSLENPLFALSPSHRVRSYEHNGFTVIVKPGIDGAALMSDRDVWIYCTSQLVEAINRGRADVAPTERRARGNPFLLTLTLFITADALRQLGCRSAASRRFREVVDLCERHEQRLMKPEALAGAEACLPPSERDLPLLYQLVRGAEYGRHAAVAILVETLLSTNRIDEAEKVMADACLIDTARHSYTRNHILRFEGDLLEKGSDAEAAMHRWLEALRMDLKNRYLPGVIDSLTRIRRVGGRVDNLMDDLEAWAEQVDGALEVTLLPEVQEMGGVQRSLLRPLISGFKASLQPPHDGGGINDPLT